MRAKFYGMEVEGTPEEILKMKDELDRREEVKHNYKIIVSTHNLTEKDVFKLSDYIINSNLKNNKNI